MATVKQYDFPQAAGRENENFRRFLSECEPAMKRWRAGMTGLPSAYVDGHESFARTDLERVAANGWRVHSAEMVPDGWLDGMRFIAAVVESPRGELLKIKWSDCGKWYAHSDSGGWFLL